MSLNNNTLNVLNLKNSFYLYAEKSDSNILLVRDFCKLLNDNNIEYSLSINYEENDGRLKISPIHIMLMYEVKMWTYYEIADLIKKVSYSDTLMETSIVGNRPITIAVEILSNNAIDCFWWWPGKIFKYG